MWYWNDGMSGWVVVAMTVSMIVFWTLVAAVVLALLRNDRGYERKGRSAEDVLRERLASGEISEDEYKRLLDLIRH